MAFSVGCCCFYIKQCQFLCSFSQAAIMLLELSAKCCVLALHRLCSFPTEPFWKLARAFCFVYLTQSVCETVKGVHKELWSECWF